MGIVNGGTTQEAEARIQELILDGQTQLSAAERRLLVSCAQTESEARAAPVSREGFEGYQHFLADTLKPGQLTDHDAVVAQFSQMWPSRADIAWLCSALHGQACGRPDASMNAAMELAPSSPFSSVAARIIAQSLKELMIAEALDGDDRHLYMHPLEALVAHLAGHPADDYVRVQTLHLASVDVSGPFGEQLLGALASCLHEKLPSFGTESQYPEVATTEQLEAFLKAFKGWSGTDSERDSRISQAVSPRDAASITRGLRLQMERDLERVQRVTDLRDFEERAALLPPLTRLVPGGADDIHAVRALAGRHAALGSFKRARELAEQLLHFAGPSASRRRLAWDAYADVYLRCHSFTPAFLGLACASKTGAPLPPSDLYQESFMLHRVARERGAVKLADSYIQRCQELAQAVVISPTSALRLEVTTLGLRQASVSRSDIAGLHSLLTDCESALRKALTLGDELQPPAFLCAQVAGLLERAGGSTPAAVKELLAQTEALLGPEVATYMRTVSASVPASEDLIRTNAVMSNATSGEDGPADAVAVTMGARRLLSSSGLTTTQAFLACELLAERGVTLTAPAPTLSKEWPEQYALAVAQSSHAAVLMLALTEDGELAGATALQSGSQLLVCTRDSVPFREKLNAWSQKYPYAYGEISPRIRVFDERTQRDREVGDGEFYESVSALEVPLPTSDRVFVVAEPEVAQLTFNLLKRGPELAGYATAFAMVPSLTWLAVAQSMSGSVGDGRRVAWISQGKAEEGIAAIEVVDAMTQDTLQHYGFTVNKAESIPADFGGASVAIVAAHGQLTSDKRFFHRIADDGELQESHVELAKALKDVHLVVLFVCSAGRVDRHPVHSTAVGLPKLLLNEGCRTVIASPWPLESLAPGAWLPAFLRSWDAGATAIDACFEANRHVAERRDREPQVSLAMTVYGDPLARHQQKEADDSQPN